MAHIKLVFILALVSPLLFGCRKNRDLHHTESGRSDLVWAMIDVNDAIQGDAHLIRHISGQTTLIDGGVEDRATKTLVPFLNQYEIRKLDNVVLSHLHFDHYGGILHLLKSKFPIKKIFWAPPTQDECKRESPWGCRFDELELIRKLGVENGVEFVDAQNLNEIEVGGGLSLKKVVQFSKKTCPVSCDLNDTSLILRLEAYSHRILFTGDLNRELSNWLVKNRKDEIKADILKVPHHGTEGVASDEFFESVGAHTSLVPSYYQLWCSERSVRIRNVLSRLKSQVFVNAIHGDVFVHLFKGGEIKILTERKEFFLRKASCS